MSEIGDAPLYNSCSLPIQVMTTGPLPAPSKCKSRRFNAWGHSSAHRTNLWRCWSRRTPPGIRQIARDLGVSHTTVNACVKEDLKCRSYRRQTSQILTEKTKNLKLIKFPSNPYLKLLDYFVWSYVENITNMTSDNTKASLISAIHRVVAELPPALVEKACSQFRIRIEAVIEAEGGYIE